MRRLLTGFIDTLFPPSTTALAIRDHSPSQWEAIYQPGVYRLCTYLSHYQQPLVQAAIKENKFQHNRHAATMLASLLSTWPPAHHPDTIFIPIPLGKKRLRERGHNQVLTILHAAGLLEKTNITILERWRETQPQSHLSGVNRAQNITGAFYCRRERIQELPTNTRIIILDDVVTTGATLEAARAVLLPHVSVHMTVECLAFAH